MARTVFAPRPKYVLYCLPPRTASMHFSYFWCGRKIPTEALLSGRRGKPKGLARSLISLSTTSQWPQISRIAANSISADRLSTSPARTSKSFLNGTSMVHPAVKLQVATQMSTSAPWLSTQILSVVATTSSYYVSAGITMGRPTNSTTVTRPQDSWMPTQSKSPGSVWSKNTLFLVLTVGLMAGLQEVFQPLRDHTIAVWGPARYTAEISLRLTTRLACSLASKSQVSTPKLCLPNGNSKLVLARALSVRGFSSFLFKRNKLTLPSG